MVVRVGHADEGAGGTFTDPGQEMPAQRSWPLREIKVKSRKRRPDNMRPRVRRDELKDKHSLIGLGMEAAGTMNRIPCDYGDGHKNKDWQPNAAAMAAADTKAHLKEVGHRKGDAQESPLPLTKDIPNLSHTIRTNKTFTGRETEMDKLWRMLFTEERERVAVVGLGGKGKAQIVLELAHQVKRAMRPCSVLWVPAQSMPAFKQGNRAHPETRHPVWRRRRPRRCPPAPPGFGGRGTLAPHPRQRGRHGRARRDAGRLVSPVA
ncbi:Nephrocystin-3 [Tolypocladium capitatum]|uniref:Nephrocystin-3 n=1 Tax=Tolypocladium capitatum TaxID=45235 RepID=A0A2K3QHL9_9HYPO|nr:Nephrocystin-3 [Tolypocladium capitatum]